MNTDSGVSRLKFKRRQVPLESPSLALPIQYWTKQLNHCTYWRVLRNNRSVPHTGMPAVSRTESAGPVAISWWTKSDGDRTPLIGRVLASVVGLDPVDEVGRESSGWRGSDDGRVMSPTAIGSMLAGRPGPAPWSESNVSTESSWRSGWSLSALTRSNIDRFLSPYPHFSTSNK